MSRRLLLGLAFLLAAACGGPGADDVSEDRRPAESSADSVVTVRTSALELAGLTTTRPRPGRIARTTTLVGELRYDPAGREEIRAPAAGRIRMAVTPGDRVARGDRVGLLASPETYPDSLPLTSSLGGRVLDLPAGTGGLVEAWSPVAVVAGTETLCLLVSVPPDLYGDVREGTRLEVKAAPGSEGPGVSRTVRVGGFVEPGADGPGLRAFARVPNRGGRLEPGMRVPVVVRRDDSVAGHWLPEPSVLYDRRRPDRTVVFVRRGSGYRQAEVEVGARTGDSVFVTSGVERSDTVVAQGSYQLLYADFSFRGIGAEAGEMEEGEEAEGGS